MKLYLKSRFELPKGVTAFPGGIMQYNSPKTEIGFLKLLISGMKNKYEFMRKEFQI